MTDKFEQIEDYLAGKLEGEARAQFERAVQNDPALAAELALHRDMAAALAPGPEDALRANLDRLGRQFAPAARNKTRLFWWIAGALLLTAVAVWLIRRPAVPSPTPTAPGDPAIRQDAPPVAQQTPDPDSAKREQKPDAPEQRRLAAAFVPNPRLEALLGSQLRGDDYRFRIVQPAGGAVLKRRGGKVDFVLSGNLETDAAKVTAPFRLLLFSNKPRDYEDFRFVLAAPLVFEKSGDTFRIQYESPLRVPPGLYYYLVEAEDSGQVFYTGKFQVED